MSRVGVGRWIKKVTSGIERGLAKREIRRQLCDDEHLPFRSS